MFDRFRVGFTAAGACLEVLRRDKKLVVFPLLSGLSCLVVLASFAIPLVVWRPFSEGRDVGRAPPWFWAVAFAFYFCNYFVIYFFNAALVSCALCHFRGMPASAGDGLRAAARRLPELAAWSLVSATVGLVLKGIENTHEKAGVWFSAILGGVWSVVTYFVVPVLVVEQVGPLQAVKRSGQVLARTWGESIGGHVGVGWALLPFWLLGVLLAVLGFFALAQSPPLGAVVIAVAVVYMLVLGLVDATLKGILLSALYLYATQGEVPDEFDREAMAHSFAAKA
jgi:hypothetical protein